MSEAPELSPHPDDRAFLRRLFLVLALAGVVKDPPPDPDAPPAEPSTFPGWWVALLIAGGVVLLMWVLSVIAAPGVR